MHPQKRIKTVGYDLRDLSDKKQKKQKLDKSGNKNRCHKQSEIHIKSVSKDITPKKHSINAQRYKYKQNGGISNVKMIKSKQLTSVCSYSAIDKESIQATKRKGSNTISVKKKKSKNNQQIQQSLKSTVSNFSILTKCLTQYIKQQKKKGNDPSGQILQLIKAFNKSEVAPLSKQLQLLISNMLDYISDTVNLSQKQEEQGTKNEIIRIKSRSSFSSASERQIAYSQILQNSFVPSTIKKNHTFDKQKQESLDSKNQRQKLYHIGIVQKQRKRRDVEPRQNQGQKQRFKQKEEQVKNQRKNKQQKSVNKQLQKQLKQDLKNMQDQLYSLKSAGQKLKYRVDNKWQDRVKLEQIYNKNKKVLQGLSVNNTESLKSKIEMKKQNEKGEQSEEQDEIN